MHPVAGSACATPNDLNNLETLTFHNGEVCLRAVAAGPASGPVVLLLHGFPEFWYGWRKQIIPLARAGFRVVVPDQRGYNESSKPKGVANYSLRLLVSDVVAIVDQLGSDAIHIAGHDWGGIVAWSFAAWHPEKVIRLAILNVPHPSIVFRFLLVNPRQLLRSWYMFFFQMPRLPEFFFSAANFRAGLQSLVRTSRPGTFSSEDLALYRQAWAKPAAARSMINWYRALLRRPAAFRVGNISPPTRILWGRKDAFLLPSLAEKSLAKCSDGEIIRFDDATHWVHLEEAEAVNNALIQFFRGAG